MLIITLLFILSSYVKSEGSKCNQLLNKDALFTLEFLSSSKDYTKEFYDKRRKLNMTLIYNFCKATISKKCNGKSSYASIFYIEDNLSKCFSLSSDKIFSNYEYKLIDFSDPSKGIKFTLTGGSIEPISNKNYQITYNINCDKNSNEFKIIDIFYEKNEFKIEAVSKYGCPVFQISDILKFVFSHKYLFAVIFIVYGAFQTFFGLEILNPTLFIIG